MIKFTKTIVLTVALAFLASQAYSQEYLYRNIMKLTAVSHNSSYGYTAHNPVMVGPKNNADYAYLNALKVPTGLKVIIADIKFNANGNSNLEMAVLTFEGTTEIKRVYINTGKYEDPKAPLGFQFMTMADLPTNYVYPEDSIARVVPCDSQKIYAADNDLLKAKVGKLKKPNQAPQYKGGKDALKKYLASHPVINERIKGISYSFTIAFMVNCKGRAGNYWIISPDSGIAKTYDNEALAILNHIPQNWQPAIKHKNPVDCYQILDVTVTDEKFEVVSYWER